MRAELEPFLDSRRTYTAAIGRFSIKKFKRTPTALLVDIRDAQGKPVADHVWMPYKSFFERLGARPGCIIEFTARVKLYYKWDGTYDFMLTELRKVRIKEATNANIRLSVHGHGDRGIGGDTAEDHGGCPSCMSYNGQADEEDCCPDCGSPLQRERVPPNGLSNREEAVKDLTLMSVNKVCNYATSIAVNMEFSTADNIMLEIVLPFENELALKRFLQIGPGNAVAQAIGRKYSLRLEAQ